MDERQTHSSDDPVTHNEPGTRTQVAKNAVEQFNTPKKTLGDLEADLAAKVIAAAGDVSLIVDNKGIIRDIAAGSSEFAKDGSETWLGRRWVDTVTSDSRQKIEDLLKDAGNNVAPRWRQVNHPSPRGVDVPVQYTAVQVGTRFVAIGRDLRGLAAMQQRLVETQQSMEREYARVKHSEARYRLLFQITSEAVMIVDGATLLVTEANPAAAQLLGKTSKRLGGRSLPELFDADGGKKVHANISIVRNTGRSDPVLVQLSEGKREVRVSASSYRHEGALQFLVRLVPAEIDAATAPRARLAEVVEKLPDGFVVTDLNHRVVSANAAFLDMVQVGTLEQVLGEKLDKWLGRHAVEVNVLYGNLRETGSVRHFATVLRGEFDATEDVEISAVSVADGEQPCCGFTIRGVARRPSYVVNGRRDMPRSVEQLTQLVGRVTLKELVRESTDVIERLCIEAALELTGDNRASAADILGLSRQSLYSKLRRHGLGDLDSGMGV
jgi:transcriptional regulator PpsR